MHHVHIDHKSVPRARLLNDIAQCPVVASYDRNNWRVDAENDATLRIRTKLIIEAVEAILEVLVLIQIYLDHILNVTSCCRLRSVVKESRHRPLLWTAFLRSGGVLDVEICVALHAGED